MCGSETTRGLSRKRSSLSASGTTKTSDCKMAVEQKAMSRDVSLASMPTRDLNHWRSSSTREIRGYGRLANKRCQQSEVVEGLLRISIEDGVLLQGGDPACFVDWLRGNHEPPPASFSGWDRMLVVRGIILQNGEHGAGCKSSAGCGCRDSSLRQLNGEECLYGNHF